MKLSTERMRKYEAKQKALGIKRPKITLTTKEYDLLKAKADEANMTVTAYAKKTAMEGLENQKHLTPEEIQTLQKGLDEVRAIGKVINDMTHIANSGGQVDSSELKRQLQLLESIIFKNFGTPL